MIKEATASTFVFHRDGATWRVALVWHPRLDAWMPPGGHVEVDECAADAALREVRDETGLSAELLPGPAVALPPHFPHPAMPAPWWVVQMRARADNHTAERHVHLDHVFVAVVQEVKPAQPGVHRWRWFGQEELLLEPNVADDSRLQASDLFAQLAGARDVSMAAT